MCSGSRRSGRMRHCWRRSWSRLEELPPPPCLLPCSRRRSRSTRPPTARRRGCCGRRRSAPTQIAFAYANNIWVVDRARRHGAAPDELSGADRQPALLARRQVDRLQRRIRRQHRRLRRRRPTAASRGGSRGIPAPTRCRGGRPTASRSCSRRRARRRRRAPRRASGPCRPRAASSEPMPLPRALSGQDLARRHAHRLPHEQLVGRGAPQLSRRPEPPDLDRRSRRRYDLVVAAVDRLEGHGPGVGRRRRSTSSRTATACERLVVRHEGEEARAGDATSPTST